MNKETLALILVMGIAGLVILTFVLNDAYGTHELSPYSIIHEECVTRTSYTQHWVNEFNTGYNTAEFNRSLCVETILMDMLEEEQKQTALLDHIDCMQYENIYGGQFSHKRGWGNCGEPLNLTGVWNP